jgi:dihydrofolate reductase
MVKLVYTAITTLDGYISDDAGDIDWAEPDPEVFRFINDLEVGIGTYLYGRRLYETMLYWETFDAAKEQAPHVVDFATMWRAADKVVFSRTLETVSSARTQIERVFDPTAVLRMKETATHDLSVGGPNLASQAMRPGWSTRSTYLSRPSPSEAGHRRCPATFIPSSSSGLWTAS